LAWWEIVPVAVAVTCGAVSWTVVAIPSRIKVLATACVAHTGVARDYVALLAGGTGACRVTGIAV
jgi:hypothetical protein